MHKLRKKGRYWYLRERSGGVDTEVATGCTDKKAAEAWARQRERDRADPESAHRRAAGQYTLQEAVDAEHARHEEERLAGHMRPRTVEFYLTKLAVLNSVFGADRLLSTIDAPATDEYVRQRRVDGVTAHTIYKELATLGLVLRGAKRAGRWFGDLEAVMPVNFSPEYEPTARNLTVDEVRAVMGELDAHRAAWVALAAGAGAELAALERAQRGDLDLANMLVRVRGTKNPRRERRVPIVLPACADLLKFAFRYGDGKRPALFTPWGSNWSTLRDACVRAKVEPFGLHTLRHAFTIWHLAAGVGFDDLAKALGHAGTAMLHRVYGHMKPEDLRDRMARSVASGEDAGKLALEKVAQPSKSVPLYEVSRETPERKHDPKSGFERSAPVLEIAVNSHESDSAPCAPEEPCAPCSGEDAGKFLPLRVVAVQLLCAVENGAPGASLARNLAVSVLSVAAPATPLWARALAVVEGGPTRMRHAVELAGLVLDVADAERPHGQVAV